MTLSTMLSLQQQWSSILKQLGKSKNTRTAYRRALEHFAAWFEMTYNSAFDPRLITHGHLNHWKRYQQVMEGAAPPTIIQRVAAIKLFFNWAVETGLCNHNPTYSQQEIITDQGHLATANELRRLLQAAEEQPRNFAMLALLIGTDIPISHLLSLTTGNVELSESSGTIWLTRGKAKRLWSIPLLADVRQTLRLYLEQEHPDPGNRRSLLWIGERGFITQSGSVKWILSKCVRAAGIPPVKLNTLHSSFTTHYLLSHPGDFSGLARLRGHRDTNPLTFDFTITLDGLLVEMEQTV
jgi:site-specific recombinase XerD